MASKIKNASYIYWGRVNIAQQDGGHGTPEPPVQHLVDYTRKTPILFQDRNTPLFIYLSLLTKIYPRTLDNNKNKHEQVNELLRTQHI